MMRIGFILLFIAWIASCSLAYTPLSWTQAQEQAVSNTIAGVSQTRMLQTLSNLNGIRSYTYDLTNMTNYETLIVSQFLSYGLKTNLQSVPLIITDSGKSVSTYRMNNIFAVKEGTDPTLAPVYFTTHWDSVPEGPGMDDNASGCAAVLEAARLCTNLSFKRTIVFVLFAFEEDGLIGSYYHEKQDSPSIYALINFDAIAYTSKATNSLSMIPGMPQSSDFILLAAMPGSRDFSLDFCRIADAFVPELKYYCMVLDEAALANPLLANTLRSDHTAFFSRGVPSLFFTDMANFRNTNYHKPTDTIDTLDMPFLERVTKACTAALFIKAEVQ